MASLSSIKLGAPGIYQFPETPIRVLTGVGMDVCAFVGVAPRGPVRVPVIDEKWRDDRPCVEPERPRRRTVALAVESFDEYRRLYGGFDGPGLLPYAVAAFFEQGGRRAYVARVVHEYGDVTQNAARVASGDVEGAQAASGPLKLRARNEGSWGNSLRVAIGFSLQPISFETATTTELTFRADSRLSAGVLLQLTLPGGIRALRFVTQVFEEGRQNAAGSLLKATLGQATSAVALVADVVEASLLIDDGKDETERHERLGLSSLHPRWMATILCYESSLVYPDAAWIEAEVTPESLDRPLQPVLPEVDPDSPQFAGGEDAYADIIHDDFFDHSWTVSDEEPGQGVQCVAQLSDLSSLVTPDLYSPEPVPVESIIDQVSLAGPTFERCVDLPPVAGDQEVAVVELDGLDALRLDPRLPDELQKIGELQSKLIDFAEQMRSFIVLLDVPRFLSQRKIMTWRAQFGSSYAAAYHPWLSVSRRDDRQEGLIRIPPSAVAAGIIARQELAFGVPHGPANLIAAGIVDVDENISPARHDELHPLGINVYLRERDGIRLSAARTLSRNAADRQLSVRRLMIMLRRVLEQKTQWIVFEPNNASLRAEVRHLLSGYLRQLYQTGAFRGATEEEAFFVRCDETLNPPRVIDSGQLIAEVGVAPAEPLEFIVLRLSRDGDGTLTLEE